MPTKIEQLIKEYNELMKKASIIRTQLNKDPSYIAHILKNAAKDYIGCYFMQGKAILKIENINVFTTNSTVSAKVDCDNCSYSLVTNTLPRDMTKFFLNGNERLDEKDVMKIQIDLKKEKIKELEAEIAELKKTIK